MDEALVCIVTWDGVRYRAQCKCCPKECVGTSDMPNAAMRDAVKGCKLAKREEEAAKLNRWKIIDMEG